MRFRAFGKSVIWWHPAVTRGLDRCLADGFFNAYRSVPGHISAKILRNGLAGKDKAQLSNWAQWCVAAMHVRFRGSVENMFHEGHYRGVPSFMGNYGYRGLKAATDVRAE